MSQQVTDGDEKNRFYSPGDKVISCKSLILYGFIIAPKFIDALVKIKLVGTMNGFLNGFDI